MYQPHIKGMSTLDQIVLRTKKADHCTLWDGAVNVMGYGEKVPSVGVSKSRLVHRQVWEALNGAIPSGLELDHLCRNPACFNVMHLELVTHRENVLRGTGFSAANARKTLCPLGHDYSVQSRQRRCLVCRRSQQNLRRRLYGRSD